MIITPEQKEIPKSLYRLRWKFHYSDGKKSRIGIWNGVSQKESDSAWAVDKTNLSFVEIEGEDVNGYTKTFINCDGQSYASMQWEAYARMPAFIKGLGGTPRSFISGLSLLTANEKFTVWVNGNVTRHELTDSDKQFKIREYEV